MGIDEIVKKLRKSIESKNPDEVDNAVIEATSTDKPAEVVPYLCELLEAKWHFDHEDITLALQKIGDSRAIDVLKRTATCKFDYLDYDDSYPLSRKCTWALADIGTEEAKAALKELAKNSDELIAEYAQKRINNWDKELKRKRNAAPLGEA